MTKEEFQRINNQPCRFKLLNGSEVFGMVWESERSYRFASLAEIHNLKAKGEFGPSIGMIISLEDLVGAEPLRDEAMAV